MAEEGLRPGPFLFDTSAESWLARQEAPEVRDWVERYLAAHPMYISAATMLERLTGYNLFLRRATSDEARRAASARRAAYLAETGRVLAVDAIVATVAAELIALVPEPPSPPKRTHRAAESRTDRLARWRFDCLIAATALAARLPLVHNNPEDFESLRMALEVRPERLPGFGPLELFRSTRLLAPASTRTATGG